MNLLICSISGPVLCPHPPKTTFKLTNTIKRFLSILIEKDIPIPEDMIDRYISKVPSLKEDEEELPFT